MKALNIALFGVAAFILGAALNATPPAPANLTLESTPMSFGFTMLTAKDGKGELQAVQVVPPEKAKSDAKPCYTLTESGGYGGLWVQHKGGPAAMLVSEKERGAFLALEGGDPFQTHGYQFAISAQNGEVYFQIRDKAGKFHFIPVEALLKLEEKK